MEPEETAVKKIEMIRGAKKLVDECVGIKEGENALIIIDTTTPLSIAEVLAMTCRERGAEPTIVVMSPTQVDGIDPPAPVGEAMQKAQVIFLGARGIFHGPSRIKASEAGARCLIMVEFTEEDMFQGPIEANFLENRSFVKKVAKALQSANEARVTTPAGTDIYLDLRKRPEKIVEFNGVYHQPGESGSINLEVAISPTVGKAQGVIVCDASTTLLKPGLIKEPFRAIVRDGKVTEISGGNDASRIANFLVAMGDPLVYNVAELAIGVNPKATPAMMKGLHRDKGVYGTCHIGIGSNTTWGGNIKAAGHFDLIMYSPKIELDGKTILENYRFNI